MHVHCRDNTDQGSQFTGTEVTGLLISNAIKISMVGKGPGGTMSLSNASGAR